MGNIEPEIQLQLIKMAWEQAETDYNKDLDDGKSKTDVFAEIYKDLINYVAYVAGK